MDQEELVLALQEIKLLQGLEHEHVLSYITCFQQDGYLCIVTEFCPNGDLSGEGFVLAIKMSLRKAVLLGLSFDLCGLLVKYLFNICQRRLHFITHYWLIPGTKYSSSPETLLYMSKCTTFDLAFYIQFIKLNIKTNQIPSLRKQLAKCVLVCFIKWRHNIQTLIRK